MNWYGNSLAEDTRQHAGYGVFEIPTNKDDPIRVLLRVGNVPFDSIEDAQDYLKTLRTDSHVLYTIAHIIETSTP